MENLFSNLLSKSEPKQTNLKMKNNNVVVENPPIPKSGLKHDLDKLANSIVPDKPIQKHTENKPFMVNITNISQTKFQNNFTTIKNYKKEFNVSVENYLVNVKINQEQSTAKFSDQMSTIGSNLSATGQVLGSKSLMQVGQGLSTFSTNLKTVLTQQVCPMDMCLGYWGVAMGVLSMAMALMEEDEEEDTFRQDLFSFLQEMHASLDRGIKRLETILIDCVCERLAFLCRQLVRMETIMCDSFSDLHRKDLLDITDAIKKDLNGEFIQTKSERRMLLRRLSTWIDCHCCSSIEVANNRIDLDNPAVLIELLPKMDVSFLLGLLVRLQVGYQTDAIPNIGICLNAANLFSIAHDKWKMSDRTNLLFKRVVGIIETTQKAISGINQSVVDGLIRRTNHFKFLLGRVLAKTDTSGDKTMQEFIEQLPIGDKDKAVHLLDSIELLRVLLEKLLELVPYLKIEKIQSKQEFLSFKPKLEATPIRSPVNSAGWSCFPVAATPQGGYNITTEAQVLHYLNHGLNVNSFCGWGSVLLHFTYKGGCNSTSAKGLHHLLKCSEIEYNRGSSCKYNHGDTWPVGSRPIQYILNCSQYDHAVIFCANGYNIDLTNSGSWGDVGNLYQNRCKEDVITLEILQLMEKKSAVYPGWFKDDLREAYKFYKQFEAGCVQEYKGCYQSLYILICILGLNPIPDVFCSVGKNTKVTNHLTYLELAKRCGNEHVFEKPTEDERVKMLLESYNKVSQFSKYLVAEKGKFLVERSETVNDNFIVECQNWLDLLKTDCENEPLAMKSLITVQNLLVPNYDREAILTNFNFLNAVLKRNVKNYQLGTNVDIWISGQ